MTRTRWTVWWAWVIALTAIGAVLWVAGASLGGGPGLSPRRFFAGPLGDGTAVGAAVELLRRLGLAAAALLLLGSLLNGLVAALAACRWAAPAAAGARVLARTPGWLRALSPTLAIAVTATACHAPGPVTGPGLRPVPWSLPTAPSSGAGAPAPSPTVPPPATAASPPPPSTTTLATPAPPSTTVLATPTPPPTAQPTSPPAGAEASLVSPPESGSGAAIVVAAGDSFWSIAARTEAQRLGRPPSPAEVGAYWVKLKAANQARLARRGDYDLVLPGQVLSLPEG